MQATRPMLSQSDQHFGNGFALNHMIIIQYQDEVTGQSIQLIVESAEQCRLGYCLRSLEKCSRFRTGFGENGI